MASLTKGSKGHEEALASIANAAAALLPISPSPLSIPTIIVTHDESIQTDIVELDNDPPPPPQSLSYSSTDIQCAVQLDQCTQTDNTVSTSMIYIASTPLTSPSQIVATTSSPTLPLLSILMQDVNQEDLSTEKQCHSSPSVIDLI